jgi:DNA polymerase III epsilon subunit family exonuclease
MSLFAGIDGAPGSFRRREDVEAPPAYAVFDCETTGTKFDVDEVVSVAVVRLDPDGMETVRFVRLVRPSRPIPAEATAVHGISDDDVFSAPRLAEIAWELLDLLDGAIFVGHNARFDLGMLQHGFARAEIEYCPLGVACTLDAFRLLEPLAENHRLQSICERHGIVLGEAHEALSDVLATAALLRVLLDGGISPETVELDHKSFMRIRARGDTRLATEGQIRRVFGLARPAGLLLPAGGVDRAQVVSLVRRIADTSDVDSLTREQVQDVYDELERLIAAQRHERAA